MAVLFFYVYALADKTIRLAADDARTAELSPDGTKLGYERGGDLFVYDMSAAEERRLTTGGSDSIKGCPPRESSQSNWDMISSIIDLVLLNHSH